MPSSTENRSGSDAYPSWIGLVFLFNLIVGTGALALPAAFQRTGWLLGLIFITILAFISYMTVTFVIETMACANAIFYWGRMEQLKRQRELDGTTSDFDALNNDDDIDSANTDELLPNPYQQRDSTNNTTVEHMPLFSQRTRYYEIDTKIELVDMARIFFNDTGRALFFLCFAIYLYGDLSIYAAAVAKTLRDVICTRNSSFFNVTDDKLDGQPCWSSNIDNDYWQHFTRLDCYRCSLIGFITLLGPFTFFNVQKTKYIQMCTILLRWMAFSIMISIAIRRLIVNGSEGTPPIANFFALPSLFGTCVYSFMCHHSLPSLVAPIKNKGGLYSMLSADYTLIHIFYLLLAMTGSFAFASLEDLYTLNFIPTSKQSDVILVLTEYFLTLFPVFTLSTSFPIIAITLRNNLEALFLGAQRASAAEAAPTGFLNFLWRRCTFPLLAIFPPIYVSFFTDSLTSLVSFTGSYAGTGIQYIIPIALVWQARKTCRVILGQGIVNEYRSPFQSNAWIFFVLAWSCTSVVFVTVNFLANAFEHSSGVRSIPSIYLHKTL